MRMFDCSVKRISRLGNQNKFHMFTLGTPIWRFHTWLYKFMRNILTNNWSLGYRTHLRLGEVAYYQPSMTSIS